MDEAVRARRAARRAVADVGPDQLHDAIDSVLLEASMTPGVIVILAAQFAGDDGTDLNAVENRAAAVQLIYDGLRLTRSLAREAPWGTTHERSAADIDVLVADVMVSRGFSLLSYTEAATKAVETVRSFGRCEVLRTVESTSDDHARCLEVDVFELAAIAGLTATGAREHRSLHERFTALVHAVDELPLADASTFVHFTDDPSARLSISDGQDDDHISTTATDP